MNISFPGVLGIGLLLQSLSAAAGVCFISHSEAFEHEGILRVTIYRCEPSSGSIDQGETIEFFTEDGTAIAGRDFVFTRETIKFEPGQSIAVLGVPLMDNGLLDGDRHFVLNTDPPPPIDACFPPLFCLPIGPGLALIRDNEHPPTRLDVTFKPEISPLGPYGPFVSELPDGRILVSGPLPYPSADRAGGGRRIAVLKPDGAIDPSFYPDPNWTEYQPLQVLPNGRVLAYAGDGRVNCGTWVSGLVRLSASGMTEQLIPLPLPGDCSTQCLEASTLCAHNHHADRTRHEWRQHLLPHH